MFVAPKTDRTDQWDERLAKVGKMVFYFWRHNGIDRPGHQLMIFKLFQLYIEHPPCCIRNFPLQFTGPQVAFMNEPKDTDLPFNIQHFTDQVKTAIERRGGFFDVHNYKYTTAIKCEQYGQIYPYSIRKPVIVWYRCTAEICININYMMYHSEQLAYQIIKIFDTSKSK